MVGGRPGRCFASYLDATWAGPIIAFNQALNQVLPFVRNPSAIELFVQGHSKYHAIAAALLPRCLIAKLTTKRMESCLSTLPGSTGTPTLGTVNTGLFQRCSALACCSSQRQRLVFQLPHQRKPIHSL